MLIINEPDGFGAAPVLKYIPPRIRRHLFEGDLKTAEELRLRCGLPAVLHSHEGVFYISPSGVTADKSRAVTVTRSDMNEGMELICSSSVYAAEDEIRSGYVTVEGGSRVGISGTAVTDRGGITFIRNVSSLNYRFPHEFINCSEKVISCMSSGGRLRSTLIISPPGCGKTTMLRDMARSLSYSGCKVSIADERREIAGMHDGRSSFDIGFSDVLEGVDKSVGMLLLLRSMSPDVIIADEIGAARDIQAMKKVAASGVVLVASLHAGSLEEARSREELAGLLPLFGCIAVLSREHGAGTLSEVLAV